MFPIEKRITEIELRTTKVKYSIEFWILILKSVKEKLSRFSSHS